MSASSFWEFAQGIGGGDGVCYECDADTREQEAPVGAPEHIDTVIVCEGCDQVVDAA